MPSSLFFFVVELNPVHALFVQPTFASSFWKP
jgi:hypothetical protein